MRSAFLSLCVAALAALTGCARSRITTEIKAGGTWVRTDTFIGQEKKAGQDQPQMTPTVDDVFVIPSGAEWKSNTVKTEKDSTIVLERSLRAGDSLKGDLSIKAAEDKLQLVNEVSVRNAGRRRVLREPGIERSHRCRLDVLGCIEVGFAGTEADDVLAFGFHSLGLAVDG